MAKTNFQYEKRQRDIEKKRKKDEKLKKKGDREVQPDGTLAVSSEEMEPGSIEAEVIDTSSTKLDKAAD